MTSSFPHSLRILLAGILSLPALTLLVLIAPLVFVLSLPSLAILVRRKRSFCPSSFDDVRAPPSSSPRPSEVDKLTNGSQTPPSHPLLHHAVITGGSSGIGLSIAIELAKRKCRHITLVARREMQLKEAKSTVELAAAAATSPDSTSNSKSRQVFFEVDLVTRVHILSVDVTDSTALEKAAAKLLRLHGDDDGNNGKKGCDKNDGCDDEDKLPPTPPPTLLFQCAGFSIPLAFSDLTPHDFKSQIDVNYLGSVNVVRTFLPYMLHGRNVGDDSSNLNGMGGNIILTSSMSGQLGTFGYSSYSPTKYALRGFAECLSMELAALKRKNSLKENARKEKGRDGKGETNGKDVHVNVSVAYPPDTDTPGYHVENLKKPEECRLISESGGVWDAGVVAEKIVQSSLSPTPPHSIYFGIDGWMLSTLTAGMSPVTSLWDAACQVCSMGLLRFVSLFYLMDFARITQNYCGDDGKYYCGKGSDGVDGGVDVGGKDEGEGKEVKMCGTIDSSKED